MIKLLSGSLPSLSVTGEATIGGDLVVNGTHPTQSVNSQTGTTYTLVIGDAQKLIKLTNASPITLTVPLNSSVSFPVGTHIDIAQGGGGAVTIAGSVGVTINKHTDDTLVLNGQYSYVSLVKVDTDVWDLIGRLVAA